MAARDLSGATLWRLGAVLGAAWAIALVGRSAVAQVASLHALSLAPHPYFQAAHAGLLYGWAPLVALASYVVFATPGALLALAGGRAQSAAALVVYGLGGSLLLSIVATPAAKLVFDSPVTACTTLALWTGISAAAALLLVFRVWRGARLAWPLAERADRRRLLAMATAAWLAVVALVPKIFWENFNLDGIEAFEFGRSLAHHWLPHWELHGGVFGSYPNFALFAYPNHWFIALFGPVEAAARLPFVLWLVALFAALVLLIEHGRDRVLSGLEDCAIWLALAVYAVVQAFNTGYEPFFADLAEMAATDTLWVLCFASACAALWAGRHAWFWIFALFTYTASPGGLLLLALLAAALHVVGGAERRAERRAATGAVLVCFVVGLLHRGLLGSAADDQFSIENMVRRLYPPTLGELARWNALLFPSGLLPAISLLAARRADPVAWTAAVVTLGYFAVLYVQAWTSLHQFAPVMVLPLVVFWRLALSLGRRARCVLAAAAFAGSLVSLALSLPRHFEINQGIREFGLATHYRVGDYEAAYEEALRSGRTLYTLLPQDYRLQYPEQPWGADPASWIYYATREKPSGTRIRYVVQPSSEDPPPGATPVAVRDGVSVYVTDADAWQRDRARSFPRVVQSPLYEPIYRSTYRFFRAFAH